MVIKGIKFIVVITIKDTYKSYIHIYGSRRKIRVSSIIYFTGNTGYESKKTQAYITIKGLG